MGTFLCVYNNDQYSIEVVYNFVAIFILNNRKSVVFNRCLFVFTAMP